MAERGLEIASGSYPNGGSADSASGSAGVASPCINVCRMDPQKQLCRGCLRTLDEITGWSQMEDEEKQAVLRRLPARKVT